MHCGIHLLVCLTSLRVLEKPEVFCVVLCICLAALGLRCGMQNLLLWPAGFSLIVLHGLQSVPVQ